VLKIPLRLAIKIVVIECYIVARQSSIMQEESFEGFEIAIIILAFITTITAISTKGLSDQSFTHNFPIRPLDFIIEAN
jgi:hypothetical protein